MTIQPLDDIKLAEIRAGLEGVTPGPWACRDVSSHDDTHAFVMASTGFVANATVIANAEHFSRLDPQTIAALLSRLDKAEAALMPFAHAAKDCGVADDLRIGVVKPADVIWESAVATSITFGHVAHAAEVLENSKAALADANPKIPPPPAGA